jgi:predicted DCC family thiol-disulfide oxidoreductase YuxK
MATRQTAAPTAARRAAAGRPRQEPLRGLTVLYDPHCRLCAFVGTWLAGQRKLIPVRLVPVGSAQARRLFPALDHDGATRREITVVGNAGQVYTGDSAWVVCLWALAEHRALAHTMSTPSGRRPARAAMLGVARYRGAQDGGNRTGSPARPLPGRMPVHTRPDGAPQAGRRSPEPPHTGWAYDGAGGWTVRGPASGRPAGHGGCADGCRQPG